MDRSPTRLVGVALTVAALALSSFACEKPSPPPGDSATSPADGGATPPPTKPPPSEARVPAVPADHALYARFEGTDFSNDCKADADCHAGGCSGEVCSADAEVITTCDVPLVSLPAGTQCGCVADQCVWWNAEGTTLPTVPPEGKAPTEPPPDSKAPTEPPPDSKSPPDSKTPPKPPKGDCGGKVCKAPQTCIEYYGIAGPRGPKFYSCEIRCTPGKGGCPKGQTCTTVADGPGSVCR